MGQVELNIRIMRPADIQVGMRLKELAGWNQTERDWEGLMTVQPDGCFVGEIEGQAVTTATAMNYSGRVGWIGMILVDPDYRRRGIATLMMQKTLDFLDSHRVTCLKLDATEAGAAVYAKLGFVTEYEVERWRRSPAATLQGEFEPAEDLSALSIEDMRRVGNLDLEVFGADRKSLLRWYLDAGHPALLAGDPRNPEAYALGRQGTGAFHIGPMVNLTGDVRRSRQLFDSLLKDRLDQAVIIDIIARNQQVGEMVASRGFERIRILKRMFLGTNQYPGQPEKIVGLAGFEFG